jgi:linoleoyl-CoA desaturase
MESINYKDLKFSNQNGSDFINTLRKRVRGYFKENNISSYGNNQMVLKTVVMLLIYFVPYFIMIFGGIETVWVNTLLFAIMGFGMAAIGLSVMHDANHGAYSKNKKVNHVIGLVLDILGGSAKNWQMQHNVLHHSFTNIHGVDEDISPPSNILRFSPHEKHQKVHKYQFIYAWFFYGLMTLSWITIKDFAQLSRYKKLGLTKAYKKSHASLVMELLLAKVIYYSYMLVIPIIVLPQAWYVTVLQFMLLHFIAGLTLAAIFQPAHVMPSTEYPLPDDNGNLDNNSAIHQVITTTNFAPKKKIFSWFVGGLNYQIEHHLFPNICHIHYRAISGIVEDTIKEYGLPYHTQKSFRGALLLHAKMLKQLGKPAVA